MAKRRGRPLGSKNKGSDGSFGAIARKMEALNKLRGEVAADLRKMADAIASGESPMPWFQGQGVASPAAGGGTTIPAVRQREPMSKAARAKIAAAQRLRWANQKGAAGKRGRKRGGKDSGGAVGNG